MIKDLMMLAHQYNLLTAKPAYSQVGARMGIAKPEGERIAVITAVNTSNLPYGAVEEITVKFEDNGETEVIGIKGIRIGDDWIK